ncbi:Glycine cleavage system T protein (aminomethyltransferase) [Sinosporangium album]|uniref:Glycine cleavage system T protein (Aminomethyltransferase) n=1 Tax=Sinosporangium album TaxID=504805 RepID=A0A1G7S2A1_9ACTN|nr:FAD-dependent oxidoreductase [Sinosporangium album]SDG17137.1 Glycine cleavage system T protein (aminomethyltransferase) [Sinosporangium album]
MTGRPRVVIIGAGIVGCALADELSRRGWNDLIVVDQGPLFRGGGAEPRAPGLIFQADAVRTMTRFASYTARKYGGLGDHFRRVGGLDVATTHERLLDLYRRRGWAASCGVDGEVVGPERCAELWPMLDPDMVHGGYHVPGDGLVDVSGCAEAQAGHAAARGARFLANVRVVAVDQRAGRVAGVRVTPAANGSGGESRTADAVAIPADVVVCAAGFRGPSVGALAGVAVPLLPVAGRYARSGPLAGLAGASGPWPVLRHDEQGLNVVRHGDRIGVGAPADRPFPVDREDGETGFAGEDFGPVWREASALLPALAATVYGDGLTDVHSVTPDGFPLLGEAPELEGFWLAEGVQVAHSAGAARALAEWLVDGCPSFDVHRCDIGRFEPAQLSPAYVRACGRANSTGARVVVHPLRPLNPPRPLRVGPFHARQRELGAVFLESAGWERPQWYQANERLDRGQTGEHLRDGWARRHWSPIAAAESRAARERVALFDMTARKRVEVSGRGAMRFLQWVTTNDVTGPPGSVTYSLMLDVTGGIRSDLTVARLADDVFHVRANSALDVEWLRRLAPGDVAVRDLTQGTCAVGVRGAHARDLLERCTDLDLPPPGSAASTVGSGHAGEVPVTAVRFARAGEPRWELSTTTDLGARLWDTLWRAGRGLGVAAAGWAAHTALRLEEGRRVWGVDMTSEHTPYEAGLGFAVGTDKEFLGRAALRAEPRRRLVPLLTGRVVMGAEPVRANDDVVGYVTSAGYGHTVERAIAYAWLPMALAEPGTEVEVDYFDRRVPAVVAREPLYGG